LAYFHTTPSSYASIFDFVLLNGQVLYFSITTNILRTSNRPLKSWRKRPRRIYPREASFYSK
jgi:hypothetical protein